MNTLSNIFDLNLETMDCDSGYMAEAMDTNQDFLNEFLKQDIDNLLNMEINNSDTSMPNGDMQIMNSIFTPEMMLWLNNDFTMEDHLKIQIKNNFNKFVNLCIAELDNKWKKENLLDNIIIPDALQYIHETLKKPNTLSEKKIYYGKRRKILEELFQGLGYQDFKNEIIKKTNAKDKWTRKDGGPSHSWWDDVMKWIRLDHFKNGV